MGSAKFPFMYYSYSNTAAVVLCCTKKKKNLSMNVHGAMSRRREGNCEESTVDNEGGTWESEINKRERDWWNGWRERDKDKDRARQLFTCWLFCLLVWSYRASAEDWLHWAAGIFLKFSTHCWINCWISGFCSNFF